MFGSGANTALIISNQDLYGTMQIIQALEDSGILLKGVTETTKNELKSQNGVTLYMLLGTLGASLLGNLLSGKGLYRSGKGANF